MLLVRPVRSIPSACMRIPAVANYLVVFDYQFNAVENGENELFRAYKEMFEIGVSQQSGSWRAALKVYIPYHNVLFVSGVPNFECYTLQ